MADSLNDVYVTQESGKRSMAASSQIVDVGGNPIGIDVITRALIIIDYSHHEVHAGNHYHATYSVADIGAQSSPDDMITLSWTTPDTTEWLHLIFAAICSSGARVRLIEGKTGGGLSPTGLIQSYNSNRNSSNNSVILDVAGANQSQVSFDATLFTGGIVLVDEHIGADGQGNSFIGGESRGDQEFILKQDTPYQLSIFEVDNVPGTLQMSWYEHTNKS